MVRVPIIRTSERRAFKRCPQLWWWAWRMGLVPLGQIAPALWLGTGVHIGLAGWYSGPGLKRGPEPAETFDKWAANEIQYIKTSDKFGNGKEAVIEEKLVPGRELGIAMLEGYLEEYGRDDSWSVIEPERAGQVDIMDPDYPEKLLAIYAFTYDLVYRDLSNDRIMLGEHKTAASIVTAHLPLDPQAGSYFLIAQPHLRQEKLIGPKEKLYGITYNFLRKALPDTRPKNAEGYATNKPLKADYIKALLEEEPDLADIPKPLEKWTLEALAAKANEWGLTVYGEVSKKQQGPLFLREEVHRTQHERATQYRRIQTDAVLMDQYRTGALALTKNETMDCRFCPFFDMCILDEGKADAEEYRESMYAVRDPYADHRKSTEES
jgi:PD-(D/E)XK nuclease superfamily